MQQFKIALVIFGVLLCNNGLEAQRPAIGGCPQKGKGKTVDLDRLKGRWYEVERSFYLYELNRRCISMDITPEGSGVRIVTKAVARTSESLTKDQAVAHPNSPGSAQFRLTVDSEFSRKLPNSLRRALPGSGNYVVLATDYDNYAIVYSCSDIISVLHADLVWVLARSREMTAQVRLQVYDALVRSGLDSDHLTITPQRDCPAA